MRPRFNLLVFALFCLFLLGFLPAGFATQPARSLPVIELFTSQGCSSCPPADALMHEYAGRPDVVALTLPVDYWDYLGWKDTLATPGFTARQRGYAKVRGDGEVYTPQTVVNGMAHVVGSHKADIDRALSHTNAALADQRLPVEIRLEPGGLTVEVGRARVPQSSSGTVWLAAVQPRADVEIERGENKGRKITYFNVVRELTALGGWAGEPVTFRLDHNNAKQLHFRYAAIVQQGTTGPILGAAWLPNLSH